MGTPVRGPAMRRAVRATARPAFSMSVSVETPACSERSSMARISVGGDYLQAVIPGQRVT